MNLQHFSGSRDFSSQTETPKHTHTHTHTHTHKDLFVLQTSAGLYFRDLRQRSEHRHNNVNRGEIESERYDGEERGEEGRGMGGGGVVILSSFYATAGVSLCKKKEVTA